MSPNLEASTGSRLMRAVQSIPDLPYDRELAILPSAAYEDDNDTGKFSLNKQMAG